MANIQIKYELIFIEQTTFHKPTKALFKCVCGSVKEYIIGNVKNGNTVSCGCRIRAGRKIKHGFSKIGEVHPLYNVWKTLRNRCYNKKVKSYKRYGAKGVKICDEWKSDFKPFYDWCISNGWEKGLHIDKDKIAKELGVPPLIYSPEMCSILTGKENSNNMSNNILVEYKQKTYTLSQLSEKLNIKYYILKDRLFNKKWSVDKCIIELK